MECYDIIKIYEYYISTNWMKKFSFECHFSKKNSKIFSKMIFFHRDGRSLQNGWRMAHGDVAFG